MKRIAVILGHPNPNSFCGALASAYAEGARKAGCAVRRIDISSLNFDPILHGGFKGDQLEEQDVLEARETLSWADHHVWIWPVWYGFAPALVKGFVERVMVPGFAVEPLHHPPYYRPLLTGRTGRVIVTMQMPLVAYRLLAGSRATRIFRKQILEFIGLKPVKETLYCRVEDSSDAKRAAWLKQARALGISDAR